MSLSDERCPKTGGLHHVHDVFPFRQFGARTIDEFCCACGKRDTIVLGVVEGDKPQACGPYLKVYQRRFTPPPDRAA